MVTRRPLELRLIHMPYKESIKPYGEFEEIKGKKFYDFDEVKQKINDLTDKLAGTRKNIINIPIKLKIYSNTCPDLTLIDLPGITRIPVYSILIIKIDSDQADDIEKVTKDMSRLYCQDKTTIILCVIPANADISTSDGLQMAKQLDPNGERTIGVITKVKILLIKD